MQLHKFNPGLNASRSGRIAYEQQENTSGRRGAGSEHSLPSRVRRRRRRCGLFLWDKDVVVAPALILKVYGSISMRATELCNAAIVITTADTLKDMNLARFEMCIGCNLHCTSPSLYGHALCIRAQRHLALHEHPGSETVSADLQLWVSSNMPSE